MFANFANDSSVDARIRQVETGLLPRVALKEDLGRKVTLEQRMRELGIPGVSVAVIATASVAVSLEVRLETLSCRINSSKITQDPPYNPTRSSNAGRTMLASKYSSAIRRAASECRA